MDPLSPVDVRLGLFEDIARVVLELVAEALTGTRLGRPALLLVGHATPPDDCCDYANVVFSGFRGAVPATVNPAPLNVDRCADVAYAAEFAVTVARGGAPTVGVGRRQAVPSPAASEAHAVALLDDVAALLFGAFPCMGAAVAAGVPWRWIGTPLIQPGRVTPFDQGGCAGWVATGAMSLPAIPPPG